MVMPSSAYMCSTTPSIRHDRTFLSALSTAWVAPDPVAYQLADNRRGSVIGSQELQTGAKHRRRILSHYPDGASGRGPGNFVRSFRRICEVHDIRSSRFVMHGTRFASLLKALRVPSRTRSSFLAIRVWPYHTGDLHSR